MKARVITPVRDGQKRKQPKGPPTGETLKPTSCAQREAQDSAIKGTLMLATARGSLTTLLSARSQRGSPECGSAYGKRREQTDS